VKLEWSLLAKVRSAINFLFYLIQLRVKERILSSCFLQSISRGKFWTSYLVAFLVPRQSEITAGAGAIPVYHEDPKRKASGGGARSWRWVPRGYL